MGLVVRICDQCPRRKVIEAKEDFFIFLQAFAGLREFGLVTGDELSRKLPEPLCGSVPGTFHGSVAWPCPEHFWAFYQGYWPSSQAVRATGVAIPPTLREIQ